MLKGMNLTEEQVSAIIDAHTETVDGLKEQLKQFKTDAEKLPEVQRELDKAQKALEKSGDAAKIQKDFDDYKAQVEADKAKSAKEAALRKVAKDAGLTDAGIAKAVKYTDYSTIELTDKGEIKDAKSLIKSLKEEWPEHINKTTQKGADTTTPPTNQGNNGKYSSKDEIMKIKDPVQRQKAIGENIALFTGVAPAKEAEDETDTE
jgi:hypothetical protein